MTPEERSEWGSVMAAAAREKRRTTIDLGDLTTLDGIRKGIAALANAYSSGGLEETVARRLESLLTLALRAHEAEEADVADRLRALEDRAQRG